MKLFTPQQPSHASSWCYQCCIKAPPYSFKFPSINPPTQKHQPPTHQTNTMTSLSLSIYILLSLLTSLAISQLTTITTSILPTTTSPPQEIDYIEVRDTVHIVPLWIIIPIVIVVVIGSAWFIWHVLRKKVTSGITSGQGSRR